MLFLTTPVNSLSGDATAPKRKTDVLNAILHFHLCIGAFSRIRSSTISQIIATVFSATDATRGNPAKGLS